MAKRNPLAEVLKKAQAVGDEAVRLAAEQRKAGHVKPPASGTGAVVREHVDGLKGRLERALADLEASESLLDPEIVAPSRFYNRFNNDIMVVPGSDMARFADGVAATGGNIMPVLVNHVTAEDRYELVYGHRRWAAVKHHGLKLKAKVVQDMPARDIARFQIIENLSRADPSILDLARQIASQLSNNAWSSQKEAAKNIGISEGYVSQLLAIAKLPITLEACHPDQRTITKHQAAAIAKVYLNDPQEFKRRLLHVDARRNSLSGPNATAILLHGTAGTNAPQRHVFITSSTSGFTLKLRSVDSATASTALEKVKTVLMDMGLDVADGQAS